MSINPIAHSPVALNLPTPAATVAQKPTAQPAPQAAVPSDSDGDHDGTGAGVSVKA